MLGTTKEATSNVIYCFPIKNVIIHLFICTAIGAVISIIFFVSVFYLFNPTSPSHSVFLGLGGGIIGMAPVFFWNMPSRSMVSGNEKYLITYIENTIGRFMVDNRLSGFVFGFKTKIINESEYLIIPRYYHGIPESIKFFEDGNGYLLRFFKVQTCFSVKIIEGGAEIFGPYRSLKILNDNL